MRYHNNVLYSDDSCFFLSYAVTVISEAQSKNDIALYAGLAVAVVVFVVVIIVTVCLLRRHRLQRHRGMYPCAMCCIYCHCQFHVYTHIDRAVIMHTVQRRACTDVMCSKNNLLLYDG